jgi:hypothetical protein
MASNERLIRKTFLGILAINLVSMVSGIASIMIDAVITGQFLGSKRQTFRVYPPSV